ncbi:MAG: hypothetical protein V4620_00655 [Bacteroidota bacterium]
MTQLSSHIWAALVIFPIFFCNSICLGQDKKYMKNVDSIVAVLDKSYNTCDSIVLNNEQFLSVTTDGGEKLTIFNCEKKLIKTIEWIGMSYGYRVRTFYTKDNKLIYVTEVHNEFSWDKDKNELDRRSTRKIYSAFYYVQNDFYHFGKMTYESEYKYRIDAPEPITYVIELVKANNEYKTKK